MSSFTKEQGERGHLTDDETPLCMDCDLLCTTTDTVVTLHNIQNNSTTSNALLGLRKAASIEW